MINPCIFITETFGSYCGLEESIHDNKSTHLFVPLITDAPLLYGGRQYNCNLCFALISLGDPTTHFHWHQKLNKDIRTLELKIRRNINFSYFGKLH